MEKEITKPITLLREDFIKSLVELINSQKIPMFIIESILKDLVNEIHELSLKQIEEDKKQYERLLKEKTNNTE